MNNLQVMNEVKNNGYRMPMPAGLCTNDYYEIILKCWNADPDKRPTFESLFNRFNDYVINSDSHGYSGY